VPEKGRKPTDEELDRLAEVFAITPPDVLLKPVKIADPDEPDLQQAR